MFSGRRVIRFGTPASLGFGHGVEQPPQRNRLSKATKPQKKRRKPDKMLAYALDDSKLATEYFMDPTPEEADEITRILEAQNHFEVLEMDADDDLDEHEDELRTSYLMKCLVLNPNHCNHPRLEEAFAKVSKAYDVLCDPVQRKEHKYEHFGGRPEEGLNFTNTFSLLNQLLGDIPPPQSQRQRQMVRTAPQLRRQRQVQVVSRERDPIDDMFGAMFEAMNFQMMEARQEQERQRMAMQRMEEERMRRRRELARQNERENERQSRGQEMILQLPGGIAFRVVRRDQTNENAPRQSAQAVQRPQVQPNRPRPTRYQAEIRQLTAMGFNDVGRVTRALIAADGDVEAAVELLLPTMGA